MTIEAQLQELIDINKAILVAIQSGAQMATAEFVQGNAAEAASTTTRKRRTKAEIAADEAAAAAAAIPADVVEGDPAGTKYWHSEANQLVFAQKPDEAAPADGAGFTQVSAAVYLTAKAAVYLTAKAAYEKAAAAKNASAAATNQAAASTEPSATAQQATASAATSEKAEPTWDEVVKGLKDLAANPSHGAAAVKAVIAKIDPNAANVPALQALNKNGQIMAEINALLNPGAAATEVDPLFG